MRQRELKRTLKNLKGLNDKEKKAIEKLSLSLVNKILHDPIIFIKKGATEKQRDEALAMVCRIFGLNGTGVDAMSIDDFIEKKKGQKNCNAKRMN